MEFTLDVQLKTLATVENCHHTYGYNLMKRGNKSPVSTGTKEEGPPAGSCHGRGSPETEGGRGGGQHLELSLLPSPRLCLPSPTGLPHTKVSPAKEPRRGGAQKSPSQDPGQGREGRRMAVLKKASENN